MNFDIDISEADGVRYLHFGSDWIQGAMRIARPWSLELDYTRDMMLPLLLRENPAWPRRILLIGLGAAGLVRFCHRHLPEARLSVVEIDPRVVAAARHHFRLPEQSDHLRIVIDDGARHIMKTKPSYDLILVDGFDADARSGDLDGLPFYLNLRQRLSAQGVAVMNLLGRRRGFRAARDRIEEAFPDRSLALAPCPGGNVIVLAGAGKPVALAEDMLRQRALLLRKATGLDLAPTLDRYFHPPGKRRELNL